MSQLSKHPSQEDIKLTKIYGLSMERWLHEVAPVINPSNVPEKEVQKARKTIENMVEQMKKGKTTMYSEKEYLRYKHIADNYES